MTFGARVTILSEEINLLTRNGITMRHPRFHGHPDRHIMPNVGARSPDSSTTPTRCILYASASYRGILKAHRMLPSMSRKGDCYDNAVAERFFSGFKNELLWGRDFKTRTNYSPSTILISSSVSP